MKKNILLVGSAGTLGKKIATVFDEHKLYLCDIEEPENSFKNALFFECDLCDRTSIKKVSDYFRERKINIDVLIYSAGVYKRGKVTEIELNQWQQTMDVNVNGLYLILHEIIPCMNEGGKIIAIASQFGIVGAYESASYCASKAAMINLIKCVALDYAKKRLKANCVCPGFFESPFLQEISKNTQMKREWMSVMGMLPKSKVDIEDIVEIVVMLSENNSITGQCIIVDGGYTAR